MWEVDPQRTVCIKKCKSQNAPKYRQYWLEYTYVMEEEGKIKAAITVYWKDHISAFPET